MLKHLKPKPLRYHLPVLVCLVAIIVLLLYKLDKIYPNIMKDLAEREARGEM